MCTDIQLPNRRTNASCAFTLIELIVVVTVSGIVVAAIVTGLYSGVETLRMRRAMRAATLLADDMMYEIRSKAYADDDTPASFGPEEVTRRDYDDVDDYDGWSKSPPDTAEGVPIQYFNRYTRGVTVVNVRADNLNAAPESDGSTSYKRIAVFVSSEDIAISNISVVTEFD